jgi:hypothetical protein
MYRFDIHPTAGPIKANPFTMAAQETMVPIMTGSGSRNGIMGTADRMPTVYREGAMDALKLPSRMGDRLHYRDGRVEEQHKLHITPAEARWWGVSPGHELNVFDTDCGKIGILICYDVEFPELARICADQNMHILFVPFLTDTQSAYMRVRICAKARPRRRQPQYGNSRNAFVTYYLKDTMKLAVGQTFYVGWRQFDADRLNIGLDRNIDNKDKTFYRLNNGFNWSNSSLV